MSVVQIAAQAGVSIATVSRVLNNSRRVNPKLAEQVHRAMAELKFDPNQIRRKSTRRAEAGKQAQTIAIISLGQQYRGWFEIPVMSAVVAEIMRVAQDHNLSTVITEMPDPREFSQSLRRQPVDGALVFISSAMMEPDVAALLAERLPLVRVMGGQLAPLQIDHVGPDNSSIGHLAGQHLLEQGCTDLTYLTTRPQWDMNKLRGQGFAAAALAAGHRPNVFLEGDAANLESIYGGSIVAAADLPGLIAKLAEKLRHGQGRKAGLFVSRDEETVVVYRLLAEHGIKAGSDVVVVSCDNERVRLSALHPQPASIDLNAAQIARHSVERLLDRMRRPEEPPVRMLVNATLVPSREDDGKSHAV